MRIPNRMAAVAAIASLAGCVSQPPEIPFDKSADNIHSIGIVTPSMPEKPSIWLASDVGQSFGLIGALVDAGMQASRDKEVWAMLTEEGKVPREDFAKAIQASLEAHGYAVKPIAVERNSTDYLKTYPAADTGTDAYLDILVGNYGYVAAGIGNSTPYRPFLYLHCRLLRASDAKVLMQDTILYDPVTPIPTDKSVTLSPDPDYIFPEFSNMEADHKRTAAGLDASFHQTADAVGHLLQ